MTDHRYAECSKEQLLGLLDLARDMMDHQHNVTALFCDACNVPDAGRCDECPTPVVRECKAAACKFFMTATACLMWPGGGSDDE